MCVLLFKYLSLSLSLLIQISLGAPLETDNKTLRTLSHQLKAAHHEPEILSTEELRVQLWQGTLKDDEAMKVLEDHYQVSDNVVRLILSSKFFGVDPMLVYRYDGSGNLVHDAEGYPIVMGVREVPSNHSLDIIAARANVTKESAVENPKSFPSLIFLNSIQEYLKGELGKIYDVDTILLVLQINGIFDLKPNADKEIRKLSSVHPIQVVRSLHHDVTSFVCTTALSEEVLDLFLERLPQLKNIRFLQFVNTPLRDTEAQRIASILPGLSHLNSLAFTYNQMGAPGLMALAYSLGNLTCLDSLTVSDNPTAGEGLIVLSKQLGALRGLRKLNLDNNKMGDESMESLSEGFAQLSLTELSLSNNDITEEGVFKIVPFIKRFSQLRELNLSRNKIGDKGSVMISSVLSKLRNLETFYFFDTQMGDRGAIAIAQNIHLLPKLENFFVSGNNMGIKGTKALDHVVSLMKTVREFVRD